MSDPVYIVCGGTGGHLAPGIATAQRFIEKRIPVELVISEKEVDSRLLQSYPDIPYRRAKGSPFGWHPVKLILFIINSFIGLLQSLKLLKTTRPVAVIAFGGYLSFSYVLASWLLKIPVILHEANRKVGKYIRSLSGMADLIYLPEGVALKGVEPARLQRMGMPIRREIQHIKKDEIRERMGIPLHAKVLAIVGGSQGAQALNEWVERQHKALAADGIWIFLVAGPGKQTLPELQVIKSDQGQDVEIRTFAFHNALHELFSASDVVISRAGAGTIAELIHCLTPSILIPYPYAADQHQSENANDIEKRGGCIVVDQKNLNTLYREVQDLIYNDGLLAKMRMNLDRLSHGDPADIICRGIIDRYMAQDAIVEEEVRA
jgi:UDP-N-acetylglucosamine--N-acetylmuramyl-(pentapeptide) pyrophosphoryl-undecaprenol N-acetylglucosamine transferase